MNKRYNAELVAKITSKDSSNNWGTDMYLEMFKKGVVMDVLRYKEKIYAIQGCPFINALGPNQTKSVINKKELTI